MFFFSNHPFFFTLTRTYMDSSAIDKNMMPKYTHRTWRSEKFQLVDREETQKKNIEFDTFSQTTSLLHTHLKSTLHSVQNTIRYIRFISEFCDRSLKIKSSHNSSKTITNSSIGQFLCFDTKLATIFRFKFFIFLSLDLKIIPSFGVKYGRVL